MEISEQNLINIRHSIGIYNILELAKMFKCGRASIDNAINNNELPYVSPNNKDRFIYLDEFLDWLNKKRQCNEHCPT